MAARPLSDESAIEALDLVQEHGTLSAAARAIGMSRETLQSRYNVAVRRGLNLSPGVRETIRRANLNPTEARGGWKHIYDDEGKKIEAVRWAAGEIDAETMLNKIRDAFEGLTPAPLVQPPVHADDDLLTLYPIADAHVGMMAWGQEAGEDYDTKKAVARLTSWMGRCVAASPASGTAVILDVGDLLHADDHTNQTPKSKHVLDVDTRYFRTVEMTIAAMATAVNHALERHARVIVRILPGNHDKTAYVAILFALAERYRNEPRVEVQKDPSEFYTHQFGTVMLAAHHGDKAKAARMVLYMADAFPDMWGATRHRFLWTGHLHHHKSEDIGGVQWEQLRALTAKDAYAASHAYSARAQLQAVTYHREHGEVGRVKVGAF